MNDGSYSTLRFCAHNTSLAFAAMLALSLFVLGGCTGDSDGGNSPTFTPNSSTENNNSGDDDPDAGQDADTGGDTDVSEDGGNDDNDGNDQTDGNDGNDANDGNDGEDEIVDGPCGPMIELGELDWGEQTLAVDSAEFDNDMSVGCGEGSAMDAGIFKFTLPSNAPGMLSVDTGGEAIAEIRIGSCDNTDQRIACRQESVDVVPQGGVPHYLIVEPVEDGPTSFDVELELAELYECVDENGEPIEEQSQCLDGSALQVCQTLKASPDISRELTVSCPTGECSEERCAGDRCDNPISVSSSFQWSGTTTGIFADYDSEAEFYDAVNSGQEPTCWSEDDELVQTSGNDLFFELAGLDAGQQIDISIDAQFQEELVVFIKEDCTDLAQCHEVWLGEEEMTFGAPVDGDFYVVVDSQFVDDEFLDIEIDFSTAGND